MQKLLLISIPLFLFNYGKSYSLVDSSLGFIPQNLEKFLLKGLNTWRKSEFLDTLELNSALNSAAEHHAAYMSIVGKVTPEEKKPKYKTVGDRSKAYGGTKKVEEIIYAISINENGKELQANAVAETILNKWKESKRERPLCLEPRFIFAGISCKLDKNGKKAYISVVLGDYNSFNTGAAHRKELKNPYTKKAKRIKEPTDITKDCKECERFKDYAGLIEGLKVNENNEIVLVYPNLKELKKLLKKPKDGFAIDIVQKVQYTSSPDYNIMDFNLVNKGIVLKKPMYTDKILAKNRAIAENKGKPTYLDVVLGKIPKKLGPDCEVNLMILQDGKVCKTLTKSYIERGDQEFNTHLELLLMPDSAAYLKPKFKPTAESTILNFLVPFEKNKFTYKPEDIKPLLDAMKEPDFKVEGIYIFAYSSIEGDSIANAQLQRKRAESIINALKQLHNNQQLVANVVTNDSWDLFRLEMDGTPFNYLTEMKKKDAVKRINSNKALLDSLEPYLAKQRFAQVILDITYDIKGEKEQKYTLAMLNKAIRKNEIKNAYKIQYFLEEAVREKRYPKDLLSEVEIPYEVLNSGLLNNRAVYKYISNNKRLTDNELQEFAKLRKLDPNNAAIKYNYVLSMLRVGELRAEKNFFEQLQADVNSLYGSDINKKLIDALNIELQFKFMEAYDTMPNNQTIMENCMNKIKYLYNFKEGNWENSLKLAYTFANFKDFRYAATLLEPFITEPNATPSEKLLFAYMSYCSQLPDKINSKGFAIASDLAKKLYPSEFCRLVGQPYMTFQILDNPHVKKNYVECGCLNY